MRLPRLFLRLHCYRQKLLKQKDSNKQSNWQRLNRFSVLKYLRFLRWTPLPMSIGIVLVAYQRYWNIRHCESKNGVGDLDPILARNWEIQCYRMLPLKSLSRVWGWVNNLELPVWARKPVLSLYIKSFGCDLSEAEEEDLKRYRNLGEFFRRAIKSEVRPIDYSDCVVSPADGKVLHYGLVKNNHLEQVKGISFSLQTFLGPVSWNDFEVTKVLDTVNQESLLHNPTKNALYHCIVYLAPGDYHRFHSPVDWNVQFRRHFSGELFSVSPGVARWIAGLFSLNERAVYIGAWQHGFFSLAAVGATNVGSIRVNFDKDLMTNVKHWKKGAHHEHCFIKSHPEGIHLKKGQFFGEFNLGSTVVLIFEAPKQFTFNLRAAQKIKVGESLNNCQKQEPSFGL